MSIEIKGINSLIKKLNKLSNIECRKAVEGAADEIEKHIKSKASVFSKDASKHIGRCDTREYKNGSFFVEVGLKNSKAPWEQWKHLFFHNYGYWHHFYGKPTGKFINMHYLWFDNSINEMEKETLDKIKNNLRKEIKACLK